MTRKEMISLVMHETQQEVKHIEDTSSKVEFFNENYELLGTYNRRTEKLRIGFIEFSSR